MNWPDVAYNVSTGNIEIRRFSLAQQKAVIVEIKPSEIEQILADLEVAAIMAQEAPHEQDH